jgi:hypothetical protein
VKVGLFLVVLKSLKSCRPLKRSENTLHMSCGARKFLESGLLARHVSQDEARWGRGRRENDVGGCVVSSFPFIYNLF